MALLASCKGTNNKRITDTTNTTSISRDTQATAALNAPNSNMEYCFFYTDGTHAQDTTMVNIHINHNKVTGTINWLPKEKDARKGTLNGTLTGNTINAVWAFNQEGSADTMHVEFRLRGNALAQKPYRYNTKTGRQQTDNTASYSVLYHMKNCK
ncbi:hypothetical protein [Mucilaginibacter sp. FT3.2]|uniref:hypothetical protein n=1 Tax=Mucilaginibacter sp. FT3.2 TaxID=2723090 RepID=UPI001622CDFF|nr:hypothetical protein [Mucilaginibacter sp. FT3.2]MBB6234898.1 hypothetical protein [Mucilaginibacter sp. FT3.2]